MTKHRKDRIKQNEGKTYKQHGAKGKVKSVR
jgi:hypothetical protein